MSRYDKEGTLSNMDGKRGRGDLHRGETGRTDQMRASEEKKQFFTCNMYQIAFGSIDGGEI